MHEAIYRNVAYCPQVGLWPVYFTVAPSGDVMIWANPVITNDRVAELDIASRVDLDSCRYPTPVEVRAAFKSKDNA